MRSRSVREAVAGWAAGFDASALTVEQCRAVVSDTAAMQGMLATVQAEAAARVAGAGSWREEGDRSPAHQLARDTGTTVGAAREALETGQRLGALPQLAEAARRGELSAAQTSAVAAVGVVAPDLVAGLIGRAQDTTVGQLREECGRAIATREADPEAKRQRIRAERSLRSWVTAGGVGVLQLQDAPDVVAGVRARLGPIREGLFVEARSRGEQVRPDALDADALVAAVHAGATMATATHGSDGITHPDAAGDVALPPHRCAPRAKVLVRIDFDALLRGRPIDGEVCEIAGYGPVAVSAVRDLLTTGDAFLAAIVTKGEQVLGVAHVGRKALARQATALEWVNPTCAVDGCTQAIRLEIDHQKPWATTRFTLTDLLDRLCEHHHDLKTREDWALIDGNGKRRFVPHTDPRHPRNPRNPRRRNETTARGDPTAA
jgi:hypothetical protein